MKDYTDKLDVLKVLQEAKDKAAVSHANFRAELIQEMRDDGMTMKAINELMGHVKEVRNPSGRPRAERGSVSKMILDFLQANGPSKLRDVVAAVPCPQQTVATTLQFLKGRGKVSHSEHLWSVV